MDAARALGHRHPLHPVHARLVFESGKNARALDGDDRLLQPAEAGVARGEGLEAPAVQLGMALVHAVEVAREQGRLLAAGAGADLEDGAPIVRLVLGQERQLDRALELRQPVLERAQLLLGEGAHLGVEGRVGQHLLEAGRLAPRRAQGLDAAGDAVQLGIFARQAGIVLAGDAGHLVAQLLAAREDRVELGVKPALWLSAHRLTIA
jgi:hypothetical protein